MPDTPASCKTRDKRTKSDISTPVLREGSVMAYRFRCGEKGGFEDVTPTCRKLTGYSPKEFLANPRIHLERIHPEDKRRLAAYLAEGNFRGMPQTFRWLRKDGSEFWAEHRDTITWGEGNVAIVEGLLYDVSERVTHVTQLLDEKAAIEARFRERTRELLQSNQRIRDESAERYLAQQALRRSEARFRKIFESAAISLWEEDYSRLRVALNNLRSDGVTDILDYMEQHPEFVEQAACMVRVQDVNQATLRVFKAESRAELLGDDDRPLTSRTRRAFPSIINALWQGYRLFETEAVALTVTSERIHMLLRASLPVGNDEDTNGLISIVDLTAEKLHDLYLDHVLTAQEDERRRIARELHDEAGQSLTSIVVGLQELQQAKDIEAARNLATRLQTIAEATVDEVGRLARGLHPYLLEDLGLSHALERFVAECNELNDLTIDLEIVGRDKMLDEPKALVTALYRIIQEAVNNVIKHADATFVSVILTWSVDYVRVVVEDDGRGFDASSMETHDSGDFGLGLQGIRERVALLDGAFAVESSPGTGSIVAVQIPLPAK